ncbi:MAG: pyridoxal phosphate-dependent aminotransferase [Thermodesulfobacteria bacterium]|nr:pyridoxal phosphate-dependent aminotransferase [Thermodesulfobacteriota bacterium]
MDTKCLSQKMVNFMERSSWIRKMFEEGARLKQEHGADKVCDFSLGNPDLPPPEAFNKALLEAASSNEPGIHAYMPNAGIPWVRDKIAQQVKADHGVDVSGQEVIMTCGAAGGLNIIFKAILNPEDEVIVPKPYFVEYGFYTDNHQGKLVTVDSKEDFSLDIDAIASAITDKTKAILINSPNNPSGVIYSEESIKELAKLLDKIQSDKGQTIYLISDEPYRKIIFTGNEVPPLMAHYRDTIVTTSFSKDLSIPGERIGYVAVHPEIREKEALLGAMTLANRILGFVNAPALMQRVVAQVVSEKVDTSIYERRRDLFADILQKAGLEFTMPQGAFYFFPKSPTADETVFVKALQKELILTVPGTGFGQPGYIRIAFCVDDEVIKRSEAGFKRAVDSL